MERDSSLLAIALLLTSGAVSIGWWLSENLYPWLIVHFAA